MTTIPPQTLEKTTASTPLITPPPYLKTSLPGEQSSYQILELLRRQGCPYGKCGNDCLPQGAFCCNPAGTSYDVPRWVCDNGQCITSVRGFSGIVDCYDPDNPSGTTQSCIDNVATTSCRSEDRCYTCDPAIPFCHWETYIATGAPTLSWFYCLPTRASDNIFYAATITANGTLPLTTSSLPISSTSSAIASSPAGTSTKTHLGTGAIAGIAAGGGIAFLILLAICACFLMSLRKKRRERNELPVTPRFRTPMELRSQELQSQSKFNTTTSVVSPQSQSSFEHSINPMPHNYPYGGIEERRHTSPPPVEISSSQRRW